MPLVDVRGFNLDPRIGQGLASGIQARQAFQQLGQQNIAAQREADVRASLADIQQPEFAPQTQQQQLLAEQTAGLGGPLALAEQPQPIQTQEEKIRIARGIDPAAANSLLKQFGLDDASKRAEMSRFAAELEETPFESRTQKINERAERLRAEGRDPANTLKLLDLDEVAQNRGLLGIQLADLSTKERFAAKATGISKAAAATQKTAEFRFKKAKDFRNEAEKFEKPFREREGAIANIRASAKGALGGNTASAISLVFNFFKVIDPTSTVREGEVATAQEAGAGVSTRLLNLYNGVVAGEVAMTPKQINSILSDAEGQFKNAEKTRAKQVKRIVSTAKRFDVPKEDIFGEAAPQSALDLTDPNLTEAQIQAEIARLEGQR